MNTPQWSLVLQDIIKQTSERQRLAAALGITNMTLSRWASGESTPQRPHLIHLVQVLQPHHRQQLLDALEGQFPDIHSWVKDDSTEQISPDFFAQVLNLRTTTTENLRFWRISDLVLKQALLQLDPNNLGMSIKLIQCMPPSPVDGKIHSLRERAGKGTPPWTADLEHDVHFLGLESMSGYAVEVRHIVNSNNLNEGQPFPAYKAEFEESAAAHPVRFEGRVAGCLLASSTQLGYFSQQRLSLLTAFSDIIAIAFDKKDFYPAHLIELRVIPPPQQQRPLLTTFRQRVTRKFLEASLQQRHLNNVEAEQQVWQDMEAELLTMPVEPLELGSR